MWDARTCTQLGEPLRHEGTVAAVAFSPQGDRVLTGGWNNTTQVWDARLWDARTGALLGEPMRHEGNENAMAFSPTPFSTMTGIDGRTEIANIN